MVIKHVLPKTALPTALTRRKQLERNVEHITQEMYRRNRELAETNQTLSLLQAIDTVALDSGESLAAVCSQIATTIASTAGFPFVGILTTSSDSMATLKLTGSNLPSDKVWQAVLGTRKLLDVDLPAAWWPEGMRSKLIPVSSYSVEQIAKILGCSEKAIQHLRKELSIKSLYVVRLAARDRLVGFMLAGFYGHTADVLPQDITLLDRLSEPVGVALDNRLLFEENGKVLAQLRRSNAKLKALDATKDDFISMASHQLRTPLTSVKGYLSMVLEGDAGKLNDQQSQLLTQSYDSAQRMVYLISDLLNLSRLNTGKFIIDAKPIDLSTVIQAEVGQLTETARARNIIMEYTPPTKLSQLMLDETKIHQVVMNFMDNAIYYTPSGGKIVIAVHETPTAIEFTVKDNGIGVPKAQQHHLFSKFYRADNARKARPDGTGLGLFMAKKVIVAQGGAIIFDSQEGKGSTFGFRFSKAGHLAPATPKA